MFCFLLLFLMSSHGNAYLNGSAIDKLLQASSALCLSEASEQNSSEFLMTSKFYTRLFHCITKIFHRCGRIQPTYLCHQIIRDPCGTIHLLPDLSECSYQHWKIKVCCLVKDCSYKTHWICLITLKFDICHAFELFISHTLY